ncbi:MAG TPA: MFS transporter [Anaerolinea thermolimosa]|uniref:Arabinose efflux permease n=1 Tax=Anaerolinea thermolimosa TaxID=229919 RepID=A0A3D1JIY3_9CHLR|nr:MFS transporter [Anaerolinea thermolimosa]GAP08617.1 arabinose efflux permease [Anaerolinea thermolimosa]HCE17728.1 MFS transporter [Anaerolinea thermolimosa]
MSISEQRRKIADFLGLKKSIVAVLIMVVLIGMGEKMAERFLPLYLMVLGGGTFSIGLLNGLDNLLSALYSLPGGYASDRLGHKKALLLFNLIAMAGYAVVIIFHYWQAVIVGAILFISWTAISLPATMDMVATVLPKNKRTMGVSVNSLVRRIPMALGPVVGGALIGAFGEKTGILIAFIVAFVLGGVSLVIQQTMIEDSPTALKENTSKNGTALLTPQLRKLLVSDILIRFCEQIPYAFVVIWCVSINRITPLQFGLLTTIEMATAVLVYIPVAYLADKSTKKPFVVTTFVFFTLFPLILLAARSFWGLVIAFIIRGLKEFGEPTRKALIMDLAPDGRKAATFGVYYLIRDVIVSIAAFGGALLWDASTANLIVKTIGFGNFLLPFFNAVASPATNFLVAFGFGLIGTLYFALFGQDLGYVPVSQKE